MRPVDLTKAQRFALECLDDADPRYRGVGAVCSSGATGVYDGQAFILYLTAEALERRGICVIEEEGMSIRRRGRRL